MDQISSVEKARLLNKLIDKSETISVESSNDAGFKVWKNLVERTFVKVFGQESTEFIHFHKLRFSFYVPIRFGPSERDYSAEHLKTFRESYGILMSTIKQYIEEFSEQAELIENNPVLKNGNKLSKIFISHSSEDAAIVEDVIEMLESIGMESTQIFCTSFDGYGIDLGDNFLDSIKKELSSDTLVMFILSENFYKSPVCLCEMGATWVLSNEHIPVLIPPLDYSDIKGVIPLTQGLKINESLKLNLLKEKIEKLFNIEKSMSLSTWERKRDRIISRIEKQL